MEVERKFFIVLILLSSGAMFLNGYPLVHFDTGNYASSFKNVVSFYDVPIDRPIFYGLYVWVASIFGTTLKLVPITQAAIFSWLLTNFIKRTYRAGRLPYYLLVVLLCASYLPFLVSAVMPDIWTSFMAIACVALLVGESSNIKVDAPLYLIIGLSVAFAPANALIVLLSLLPFGLRLLRSSNRRVISFVAASVTLPLLLCAFTTYLTFRQFKVVKGDQAFLFARFAADKTARAAIEQFCGSARSAVICQRKDEIEGKDSNEILWTTLSDELDLWRDKNKDIATIVRATIIENFLGVLFASVRNSLKSVSAIPYSLADLYGARYESDRFVYRTISTSYPADFPSFSTGLQQANADFYLMKRLFELYAFFAWVQIAIILAYCLYKLLHRMPVDISIKFAFSFALANVLICASMSGFDMRYNVKGLSVSLLIGMITVAGGWAASRRTYRFAETKN